MNTAPLFPPGDPNRRAVILGKTYLNPSGYNGWDGDCPGCDIDAGKARDWCHRNGITVSAFLLNRDATVYRFVSEVQSAAAGLSAGGLLFIFDSGHGGQVPDTNGDEASGMADTLCMYDRPMVDDEVGAMLDSLPQDLRVFMVSDTCNSGTSFRNGPPVVRRPVSIRGLASNSIQIVHFAACADGQSAIGGAMGGVWTHVLDVFLKPGITYRDWFTAAQAHMPPSQIPVLATEPFEAFAGMEALK